MFRLLIFPFVVALKLASLWLYFHLMHALGHLFFRDEDDFYQAIDENEKTLARTLARHGVRGLFNEFRTTAYFGLGMLLFLIQVGIFWLVIDGPPTHPPQTPQPTPTATEGPAASTTTSSPAPWNWQSALIDGVRPGYSRQQVATHQSGDTHLEWGSQGVELVAGSEMNPYRRGMNPQELNLPRPDIEVHWSPEVTLWGYQAGIRIWVLFRQGQVERFCMLRPKLPVTQGLDYAGTLPNLRNERLVQGRRVSLSPGDPAEWVWDTAARAGLGAAPQPAPRIELEFQNCYYTLEVTPQGKLGRLQWPGTPPANWSTHP